MIKYFPNHVNHLRNFYFTKTDVCKGWFLLNFLALLQKYQMLQRSKLHKDELIEPCNPHCSFCFLNYADTLGENSLFQGLKKDEIGDIIRNVQHTVKKFSKGDLVASEGDPLNHLIIVVKGSVVGEMMDFEGKVLRVELLKAPDTIATAFLFGNNNRFPVNVTAQEDTRLLYVSKIGLMDLFSTNQQVMQNFLDIMANRAQFLSKQMKILGLGTIRGKVAHFLLEQVKRFSSLKFRIELTQSQLAERFGVTRPSLARTLREMNDEGYIVTKGKEFEIRDKAGLAALLR